MVGICLLLNEHLCRERLKPFTFPTVACDRATMTKLCLGFMQEAAPSFQVNSMAKISCKQLTNNNNLPHFAGDAHSVNLSRTNMDSRARLKELNDSLNSTHLTPEEATNALQEQLSAISEETHWSGFAYNGLKHKSTAPSTCTPECGLCSDHFVPKMSRHSPKQARLFTHDDATASSTIKLLVETTEIDYAYVRERIDTYGNAIAKRWQKTTVAEREKLIRAAMLNILADRHSDMEIMFKGLAHVNRVNARLERGEYSRKLP